MRLALFGGSGRTGRELVRLALEQGHDVAALARDPARLPERERLRAVTGDATDGGAVARTVEGSEAVLSVLGHSRGSPPDLLERWARHAVAAMREQGVERLVVLTGAGVRAEEDRPKAADRVFAALLRVAGRRLLRDSTAMVEAVRASGLAWTVVRAPRLVDGPATGGYAVGYVGPESGVRVRRADVADFMLREAAAREWVHRLPVVSERRR